MAIAFQTSTGAVSSSERPDLGKSMVPKRHIFFEEADDDDEAEEFIRPPVQKNARVGNISFAGNGGDHGGRRPNKQYNDSLTAAGLSSPKPEKWRSAKSGRSEIPVETWFVAMRGRGSPFGLGTAESFPPRRGTARIPLLRTLDITISTTSTCNMVRVTLLSRD
jgi:hypothetical protein